MLDGAIMRTIKLFLMDDVDLKQRTAWFLAIRFVTAYSHTDLPPRKWHPNHMWVHMYTFYIYIYNGNTYICFFIYIYIYIYFFFLYVNKLK